MLAGRAVLLLRMVLARRDDGASMLGAIVGTCAAPLASVGILMAVPTARLAADKASILPSPLLFRCSLLRVLHSCSDPPPLPLVAVVCLCATAAQGNDDLMKIYTNFQHRGKRADKKEAVEMSMVDDDDGDGGWLLLEQVGLHSSFAVNVALSVVVGLLGLLYGLYRTWLRQLFSSGPEPPRQGTSSDNPAQDDAAGRRRRAFTDVAHDIEQKVSALVAQIEGEKTTGEQKEEAQEEKGLEQVGRKRRGGRTKHGRKEQ